MVATLVLGRLLEEAVGAEMARQPRVSRFVEADGTRLARRRGAAPACSWPSGWSTCPARCCSCGWTARSARPSLIPNLAVALVLGLSVALFVVVAAAGARRAPPRRRRGAPGRSAVVPQGDGRLARHRVARARPERPHHLRQPGLLRDGRLQRRGRADGAASTPPYWPPEHGRRLRAPPGRGGAVAAGARASPRARASRPSSCAATASAFRC